MVVLLTSSSCRKMEKVTTDIIHFNGEINVVIGKVVMPITVKKVTIYMMMMFTKAPSAYNVIFGLSWIHDMNVVPSTYHHMLNFPSAKRVEVLRSSQKITWTCYVNAM